MIAQGNSLLLCIVAVGLLLFTILNNLYLYFVTATEEHESEVLQVECSIECSQPAGELTEHYYVLL